MKVINLNEFLQDPVFLNCFVCGDKKYNEFYFNDAVYRVCAPCLKKEKVKKFFSGVKQ